MKIAVVLSVIVACCVAVALGDYFGDDYGFGSMGGLGGFGSGLGSYGSYGSYYSTPSYVPVPVAPRGGSGIGGMGIGRKCLLKDF